MSIVYRDGKKLTPRSAAMFDEWQRLIGRDLTIVQGSYNDDVSTSAGTHDGGGALDADDGGMDQADVDKIVYQGRRVGFAVYWRPTIPGKWGSHFHAIELGCPDASPAAKAQMAEYLMGGDGLKGTYPDPHRDLNAPKQTWEQYLASKRQRFPLPAGEVFGYRKSSRIRNGTESPQNRAEVMRIQKRVRAKVTGVFDMQTALRVLAWRVWKKLGRGSTVGPVVYDAMF